MFNRKLEVKLVKDTYSAEDLKAKKPESSNGDISEAVDAIAMGIVKIIGFTIAMNTVSQIIIRKVS